MGIAKGTKLGPRKLADGTNADDVPWILEGERISGGKVTNFTACVTAMSAGYAKAMFMQRQIAVFGADVGTQIRIDSARRRFK